MCDNSEKCLSLLAQHLKYTQDAPSFGKSISKKLFIVDLKTAKYLNGDLHFQKNMSLSLSNGKKRLIMLIQERHLMRQPRIRCQLHTKEVSSGIKMVSIVEPKNALEKGGQEEK